MTPPPPSEAIQDYLKGIDELQHSGGRVTVTTLARSQGVSPASASAMVKKLALLDLLEHEPYRGARLTEAGERVALGSSGTTACSSSTSPTPSGCTWTTSTPRPTGSSTPSPRSSRNGSTARSGARRNDPHGDPIPDAK